ncbi:hypothetical protein NUW58_g9261 [Xylaria curta]|uniref:Uncharacterized protein n=1 Tax=Xylaria curta TaxID=42375 RepID=A0ACC1N0S5_9PEZI|nr:hypothetical protein NUW58_g9261 [Xylaria curta]
MSLLYFGAGRIYLRVLLWGVLFHGLLCDDAFPGQTGTELLALGTPPVPGSIVTSRITITTTVTYRPSLIPGNSQYTLVGCYSEPSGDEGQIFGSDEFDVYLDKAPPAKLTMEGCLQSCGSAAPPSSRADHYAYAGLRNGSDCICGFELSTNAHKLSVNDCIMPCSGDRKLSCGGRNKVAIYSLVSGDPNSRGSRSGATKQPVIPVSTSTIDSQNEDSLFLTVASNGTPRPSQGALPPSRDPLQRSIRPIAAATESGPTPAAAATTTPSRSQPKKSKVSKAPGTPRSDRNIDTIVFGDTSFKAWYPSYYGKEVLGDGSANVGGGHAKIGGAKRDTPPLARLYVCPCCFKYSKEVVPWSKHVQYCGRKAFVPGTKVYTHPRHLKTVSKPSTDSASTSPAGSAKGKGKSTLHNGNLLTGDAVTNEGEWSVWEVDGEKDGLFCQNLSLFAKLFLDNKSVFFDVTGFNYFLLVYTPPPSKTHQAPLEETDLALESLAESANSASTSSNPHIPISTSLSPHPRPQIVGFFSKEKMSWDNNNLACILVFPPWQRKGLGALLMGVSYEISRREGILGGPEKPISELGRKGYRRFWAGEITRWILGLDLPTSSAESADTPPSTKREKEKEKERSRGDKVNPQKSLVVDVEQCSRDTWIVLEDCLAVLREMGVVEKAGLSPPDNERDPDRDGAADANTPDKEKEGKEANSPPVSRIRIDKAAIRRWAHENKIELTRACDPDGFVEGYAIKRVEDNDGEE